MYEAPSRTRSFAAILLLALVSAAAGCHHGPAESSTHEGGQATGTASAVTVGVPDACTAISATDLAATFGEVGTGTPAGDGSRRICRYENGTIVGISEANQYEPSVALARQSAAECSDLTGVGDRAAFCVTGGVVGQLLWVSGNLMYDVTGGQTDEAVYTALAGKLAHAH